MLRVRTHYMAAALLTIIVGLIVHTGGTAIGPVAQDVLGDALWAAMIVWLAGAVAPRAALTARLVVAYLICGAVELSQLYHTPALDALRATFVGHLVLGSGFDPRDLGSYALGVAGAALVEVIADRNQRHNSSSPPDQRT